MKITESEAKQRIEDFWDELNGIMKLSKEVKPGNPIYDYDSGVITNYLLWRLLQEIKKLNQKTLFTDGSTDKK